MAEQGLTGQQRSRRAGTLRPLFHRVGRGHATTRERSRRTGGCGAGRFGAGRARRCRARHPRRRSTRLSGRRRGLGLTRAGRLGLARRLGRVGRLGLTRRRRRRARKLRAGLVRSGLVRSGLVRSGLVRTGRNRHPGRPRNDRGRGLGRPGFRRHLGRRHLGKRHLRSRGNHRHLRRRNRSGLHRDGPASRRLLRHGHVRQAAAREDVPPVAELRSDLPRRRGHAARIRVRPRQDGADVVLGVVVLEHRGREIARLAQVRSAGAEHLPGGAAASPTLCGLA